jgi:uncharacterized protein DUF4864
MPGTRSTPMMPVRQHALQAAMPQRRVCRSLVAGAVVLMASFCSVVAAQSSTAAEAAPSLQSPHAVLAEAEWQVIQRTIADQLAALRSGDASRAFSFASAGIRERFGDADIFLGMVRGSYGALLDARYTEFLEGAVIDGHTIQPLRLVLNDETVLVALYEMQRDERGGWRIAGCVIAPSTVRSI